MCNILYSSRISHWHIDNKERNYWRKALIYSVCKIQQLRKTKSMSQIQYKIGLVSFLSSVTYLTHEYLLWSLLGRKPYCDFFEKKILLTAAWRFVKKKKNHCICRVKEDHYRQKIEKWKNLYSCYSNIRSSEFNSAKRSMRIAVTPSSSKKTYF